MLRKCDSNDSHTRTVDMPSVAKREADIVIAAAGRAGVVGADYVREGTDSLSMLVTMSMQRASFVVMLIMRQLEPIVDAITIGSGEVVCYNFVLQKICG